MATTPEQVDMWLKEPSESQHLEFKEAKTQLDSTLLHKYCVAIANEGGGRLVLGVTNDPPRRVIGTQAVRDLVEMTERLFIVVGFRVDIEEVPHPDGRCIVFHIPSRPRGTAYHYKGAYLMRSGEQLVPMSEDKLRAIFAEGEPAWEEEHAVSGVSAAAVVQMLDAQKFFDLLQLPYPSDRSGVIDRLKNERLIDDNNGAFAIRRIAGLILARHLSDFPDLARKAPRVVVYSGKSKLETKLDQIGNKGYAVGFQDMVRFIMSLLPQNEVIEDALRKEVRLIPEIIIRELVANALIHQDLTMTGTSAMVEIYDDRIEVSSPGKPIVPVERFIDGYQSRNERLADIMRRLGICEEKSSGIDRVVNAAEAFQLPAPDFRSEYNRTCVIIYGAKDFAEMDREDRIRACYQHCVLRYVISQSMTNQSLRERFHLPDGKSAIVSQVITATTDAGLIKADEQAGGSKKFARYIPYWA